MPMDRSKRAAWVRAGYRGDAGSASVTLPPSPDRIRLYYMTTLPNALSNITFGRVKLARFREANDPFELLALNVLHPTRRRVARNFLVDEDESSGMLCLSEDWTSPVMWSHYADRHRGVCLGFDVARTSAVQVSYQDKRIRSKLGTDVDPLELSPNLQRVLRTTKCSVWSYEREWRVFVPWQDAEPVGRLHFKKFDSSVALAEVILGPLCEEQVLAVRRIVNTSGSAAVTFASRLAWGHFKVVPLESSVP